MIGIIGGLLGNAGLGAWQSMDFGKVGMMVGAGVGVAGWGTGSLANEALKDEEGNETLSGILTGAFLTGGIQSGYSSFKEIEAFKKPNSIAALSSVNSTTTTASLTYALDELLSKDSLGKIKKDGFKSIGSDFQQNMLSIDNFGSDAIKLGMVRKKGLYNAMMDGLYGVNPEVANFVAVNGAAKNLNPIAEHIAKNENAKRELRSLERQKNFYNEFGRKPDGKFIRQYEEAKRSYNKELGDFVENNSALRAVGRNFSGFQMRTQFLHAQTGKIEPNIKGFMEAHKRLDGFDPDVYARSIEEIHEAISSEDFKKIIGNDEELLKSRREFIQNSRLLQDWNPENKKRENIVVRGAKGLKNYVADNVEAADSKSNWFSEKPVEINEVYGDDVRQVKLNGDERIEKRMQAYIDTRPEEFEQMFNMLGKTKRIQSMEDYKKYLGELEPGAYGTYKSLERAGVYGENSNAKRKALGFMMESFNGSPLWSRAVDYQIKDAVKKGTYSTEAVALRNLREGTFKGKGGKLLRMAGLAGDTVGIGGGLFAVGAGISHLATTSFRGGSNDQSIQSNNAVNPV